MASPVAYSICDLCGARHARGGAHVWGDEPDVDTNQTSVAQLKSVHVELISVHGWGGKRPGAGRPKGGTDRRAYKAAWARRKRAGG